MTDHPIMKGIPRHASRHIINAEDQRRKSGNWGEWETINLTEPKSFGHVGTFQIVHRNKVFAVLDRMDFSGARHLAISSLSGIRPSWKEAQRIKDELAGELKTAVEVYPPRPEIVDQANMYHLWVMPGSLPFSLAARPLT